jgi:hypothetical protein
VVEAALGRIASRPDLISHSRLLSQSWHQPRRHPKRNLVPRTLLEVSTIIRKNLPKF